MVQVNKRSILKALVDGEPRTLLQIIDAMGASRDARSVNEARTTVGRCFKEGQISEVTPRQGREKIWIDMPAAIRQVDRSFPFVIGKDGSIECVGKVIPNRYRFSTACKQALGTPWLPAKAVPSCSNCHAIISEEWNYCPKCSMQLK